MWSTPKITAGNDLEGRNMLTHSPCGRQRKATLGNYLEGRRHMEKILTLTMWSTVTPASAAAATTLALLEEYVIFNLTADSSGQLYTRTDHNWWIGSKTRRSEDNGTRYDRAGGCAAERERQQLISACPP